MAVIESGQPVKVCDRFPAQPVRAEYSQVAVKLRFVVASAECLNLEFALPACVRIIEAERPRRAVDEIYVAGVVQWQNVSFPS